MIVHLETNVQVILGELDGRNVVNKKKHDFRLDKMDMETLQTLEKAITALMDQKQIETTEVTSVPLGNMRS